MDSPTASPQEQAITRNKMTPKQEKLKRFMEDPNNWRPPSFTQVMRHMGWKSKNQVSKTLRAIRWGGLKPKSGQRTKNLAHISEHEITGNAFTDSSVQEIRVTSLKKEGYSAPIFINDVKRR